MRYLACGLCEKNQFVGIVIVFIFISMQNSFSCQCCQHEDKNMDFFNVFALA